MNFDVLNYVWVPIVLFLICGIPYYKSSGKNLAQPRFLKVFLDARPIVKYLVYLAVLGASCSLLTGLAQVTASKFILELERIIFLFHIYSFICFVYLTVNPLSELPRWINKGISILLLIVGLAQIVSMTVGMTNTEEMLSFKTLVARFNNNWLWFAGVSILMFAIICVGSALAILLRALREKTYSTHWFSYRCFSLIVLASFQLVIYSLDLAGHLLSRIGPWPEIGLNCSRLHAVLINFLVFPFFLLLPLDKLSLHFYDRLDQSFARRYVEKLRWLHSLAFVKLQASYSFDPYEFFDEPEELLDHVIISLNDFRNLLYRMVEQDYQVTPNSNSLSFNEEAKFWAFYLGLHSRKPALPKVAQVRAVELTQTNENISLTGNNLSTAEAKPLHSARFYLKLSKSLHRQQKASHLLPSLDLNLDLELDLDLLKSEVTQIR